MATHKSTTKGAARAFAQHDSTPGETQHAPAAAADRHIELLGQFSGAIDMVKTAAAALESDERTTFSVTVLQFALDILLKVYNEVDREVASGGLRPPPRRSLAEAILAIPPSSTGEADLDPARPRHEPRAKRFARLFDELTQQSKPRSKGRNSHKGRAGRRAR
jgi:hypothetical protein